MKHHPIRLTVSVRTLPLSVALALCGPVHALPVGGEVTAGSGSVAQSGSTMTVGQGSPYLALDWRSFNIGAGESVRFVQPSASAIAVNRVRGQEASRILGSLDANGKVFLINPSGILFGRGAQVNVGSLVASSLDLTDADIHSGRYRFTGKSSDGAVINQGTLNAADGGSIALLGPQVRNEGTITAQRGQVLLAAGEQITLALAEGSPLGYSIDRGTLAALVGNSGTIRADGGEVTLTAKAADALARAVVNHDGVIEAHTLDNRGGVIRLLGDMQHGEVVVNGKLDASAPQGGDGGFIDTSAAHVKIGDAARVTTAARYGKAGNWLIDPTDYVIAFSGGDITPTALASFLVNGNVTIQTVASGPGNGDIFVNDSVVWSGSTRLTLNAHRHINVNAPIVNSGGGSLVLRADLLGSGIGTIHFNGAGSIALSGGGRADLYYNPVSYASPTDYSSMFGATPYTAWMLVNDVNQLQNVQTNLAGSYALGRDIDATATAGWNSGAGFMPIGTYAANQGFRGAFDGINHVITGLTINRPGTQYIGLFGYVQAGASVSNLQMKDGIIRGFRQVGAVAGRNSGTLRNVSNTGAVTGTGSVGGISGTNVDGGTIDIAWNAGEVRGSNSEIGGLVGFNDSIINRAWNSGNVITTANSVGGIAGYNFDGAAITNVYNTGAISGAQSVGGLVGESEGGLRYGYNTGAVTGTSFVGALGGRVQISGVPRDSYYDTGSSGVPSAGGTGLSSSQMMQQASFNGFDFNSVWRIYDGNTRPMLKAFLTPLTITAGDASKTYDGQAYSGGNGVSYSGFVNGDTVTALNGMMTYGGTSQGAVNAGTYIITPGGYWSTRYDISYGNGALTVNKAPLTVSANDTSMVYNGQTHTGGSGVAYSGFVNGETAAALGGTLNWGGSAQGAVNAGLYTLTPSGLTSNNYAISHVNGSLTITPAPLVVTANNVSKVYDGQIYSGNAGASYTGFVNGETAAALGGTLTWGGSAQGAINAGSYAITPSGLSSNNYTIVYASGTLTINPALLTVAAANASKTHDGQAFSGGNGVVYSGFVNGETQDVLSGTLAYGGSSQGAVNAGSYTIMPTGLASGNYAISFVGGTLTVSPDLSGPTTTTPPTTSPPSLTPLPGVPPLAEAARVRQAELHASLNRHDDSEHGLAVSTTAHGEDFLPLIDGGMRLPAGLN
ncbi:MBG domain-containing protein [Noviherbaspirillum cavernae]|nr:MBG domain-containing protein [Noviherbaspirillum cavernae]